MPIVFLISVTGASAQFFKVTKKNYEKIKIGMSHEEVIKTIGKKPDEKTEDVTEGLGKTELWVYRSAGTKLGLKRKGILVYFQNGKVVSKNWVQ